jgi:hypothetical protein
MTNSICTDAAVAGAIVMFIYMVVALFIALTINRYILPKNHYTLPKITKSTQSKNHDNI